MAGDVCIRRWRSAHRLADGGGADFIPAPAQTAMLGLSGAGLMPDRPTSAGPEKPPSLARIAAEIAGARLELALLRASGELKYRQDQSRLPKGQTGGGRFADEGRGTSHRAGVSLGRVGPAVATRVVTRQAARSAAGAVGAAAEGISVSGVTAAAAAAAAPLAVGAAAMSSVTGLATHYMTGAPVTPLLHIPATGETTLGPGGRASAAYSEMLDQCNDEYEDDWARCNAKVDKLNLQGKARADALRICRKNAADRLDFCIKTKNLKAAVTPLFRGMPGEEK